MLEDGRVNTAPGWWLFGVARLDDANARLIVDGRTHELDHSSHRLLQCLLAQAGNLVSKEELLHAGWPGRVVSENSLAKAIGRLRQALDDPEGLVLVTVHGYGYRLATRAEYLPSIPEPRRPITHPPRSQEEALEEPIAGPTGPARWSPGVAGITLVLLLAPIATWWFVAHPSGPLPSRQADMPLSIPLSIAVLPFADMSQAGDQEYFSDGLADELLDQLSKLPQLRVAGRTSSFSFRGKSDDVASIGRKLNVANVLEGSVRKSGQRIRITVQLIDVANGFHLWSETYDRQLTDLFAVQDEITRSVVAALKLKLLPGQSTAVTRHRTSSPEAFGEYTLAVKLRSSGQVDDDRRAIAAYERAIALDPDYTAAYAGLADTLGGDANYADSAADVAAGKARSLLLMDRAIALDPGVAESYLARADIRYSTSWDWRGAQGDLDRAAALVPGENVQVMMRQCRLLAALDRLPQAITLETRATELDPASNWAWAMLGYHSAVLGRYPQARDALTQAHKLLPTDNHVTFYIGLTSLLEGRPEAALIEFQRSGGPFRLAGLAMAQHDAGQGEASQRSLEALVSQWGNTAAYQVVEVHAWRGEIDQAFAWMDRASSQRDAGLIYIQFDPLLKNLRGDPRYARWLRKMRFPA